MWAGACLWASSRRSTRRRCADADSQEASMDISLANRAAIVTGGSKGLGYAIASRFAASGADVVIAARGREALDQAVKTIGANARGRVIGAQGDVGVAADIKSIYDTALGAF